MNHALGKAVCAMLWVLAAATAHAHSRPPFVDRLRFDPSDPDHIVAGFSYGLLVSEDGGASWRFVCAGAYRTDAAMYDPDFVVADDGSLSIAVIDGIFHGDRGACSFDAPSGSAANTYVGSVAVDPHAPNALWATTAALGESDALQRSTDDGRTWAPFGDPIADVLVERVAVAPSDPMRLYLSGYAPLTATEYRRGFLLRSIDGGRTFERIEITLVPDELVPEIVAVDPSNEDRLFVRVEKSETDATPERLLYSDDGGRTFTEVFSAPRLVAFAISPDGQTAWAGSSAGGLWIARGGVLTFEQIGFASVRCLAARADELWLCLDPSAGRVIGRSIDQGANIETVLSFEEVTELVPCDRCDETNVLCSELLDDLVYDVDRFWGSMTLPMPPFVDAGLLAECADAGAPLADAGARDAGVGFDAGPTRDGGPGVTPGGGCGCSASARAHAPAFTALLLLFALLRGRARSRPGRRCSSR